MNPTAAERRREPSALGLVASAALPLVLLAGVLALVAATGLPAASSFPVEDLAVERTTLAPGEIAVRLRNFGPEPLEIAQVIVNDAIVSWTIEPAGAVPRLRSATMTAPFDWVEGEPVAVAILTTNAIKFETEVAAAVATPVPDAATLGTLTLLGLYVGAIPVLAGLLWKPVVARVGERGLHLALGITVGLLLFLAADALLEGFEGSEALPGALGGPILLVAAAALAYVLLELVSRRAARARAGLALAVAVAIGIGLHNLAEGLAIGGAFALGEVALGLFLVVGFAVHNTTEGLAIVAPVGRERVRWPTLVGLGLVAGLPVVPGAWIGAFAPSPALAVAFLGVGAGAIAQVAVAIDRGYAGAMRRGWGLVGVVLGLAIMYVTSLFVVV